MGTDYPIVFFSKIPQALLQMATVQEIAGGVFITNRTQMLELFRKQYPELTSMKHLRRLPCFLTKSGRILKNAKVICSGAPHKNILDQFDAQRVMFFHGTYRFLGKTLLDHLTAFDHLFLIGPRMQRIVSRFQDQLKAEISVPGYIPFTSFKTPKESERIAILRKLGLDPEKPTVSYLPARHSLGGSWRAHAERIARETALDYNLVLRPHPSEACRGAREVERTFSRIKSVVEDRPNAVLDLTSCSLPELFSISNLIISDANSPAEESMFYDTPQLFTEFYPREEESAAAAKEELTQDELDDFLSLYECGPSFAKDGFSDWGQAIKTALEEQEQYQKKRTAYFESTFGPNREQSGRIAAENLMKIAQQVKG